MSHKEQRDYVRGIRSLYPIFFKQQDIKILDIGSLDINGSCRRFFSSQFYIGCDIGKGKGVDIISPAHRLTFVDNFFDCIISCEAFEHDPYLPSTLVNSVRMLKSGGLLIFTCASKGREEHGTINSFPDSSPYTNYYYKNITIDYLEGVLNFNELFSKHSFDILNNDLRFFGIKK